MPFGFASRRSRRTNGNTTVYDGAISLRRDHAEALNNRGNVLQDPRRPLDALESYDRALEHRPAFAEALENKAILLFEFGRLDAAREALEAVPRAEPRRARAHFHLARIKSMRRGDPQLEVLERLEREQAGLAEKNAIDPNFALGKAYGDIGDYERAFAHFAKSNALKRSKTPYDEAGRSGIRRRHGGGERRRLHGSVRAPGPTATAAHFARRAPDGLISARLGD